MTARQNKIEQLVSNFCPGGVRFKTLGELGYFYGGLSGKSKGDFSNGNAKYITYMNIASNIEINTDINTFVKVDKQEHQNIIEYGDVLFTGSSETPDEVGMSSVLTKKIDEPLYLNSFCFGFRLYDKCMFLPEFLKYLFRGDTLRKQIINTASGVTRFNVSKKRFAKISIPIPPIELQKEIVKTLNSFTELEKALKSELKERKKQYIYYRNFLLTDKTFIKQKLGDIANIFLGLTYTPEYTSSGVKFISAQNTSQDYLDLNNVKYISQGEYSNSTLNAKPKRGDMLFTRVGSNLGHPVIIETDELLCIFVSLGFIRVKTDQVLISYIKHWMNTDLCWDQIRKNVHGSAKVNLNTGWLKKFELYLPSLVNQKRIVSILDKFDALVNDISIGLPAEINARKQQYEYYRNKLLTFKELK